MIDVLRSKTRKFSGGKQNERVGKEMILTIV